MDSHNRWGVTGSRSRSIVQCSQNRSIQLKDLKIISLIRTVHMLKNRFSPIISLGTRPKHQKAWKIEAIMHKNGQLIVRIELMMIFKLF
jgi:hypothetical protein